MNMSVNIPTTLKPFVDEELSSGKFASESELVITALELYREMKERHSDLRSKVEKSAAQADAGLATSLDMEDIKSRLSAKFDANGQPK